MEPSSLDNILFLEMDVDAAMELMTESTDSFHNTIDFMLFND